MSVSLGDVIENAGYDIANNIDDINWLLAQRDEFDELIEYAEERKDILEEDREDEY